MLSNMEIFYLQEKRLKKLFEATVRHGVYVIAGMP